MFCYLDKYIFQLSYCPVKNYLLNTSSIYFVNIAFPFLTLDTFPWQFHLSLISNLHNKSIQKVVWILLNDFFLRCVEALFKRFLENPVYQFKSFRLLNPHYSCKNVVFCMHVRLVVRYNAG